MSESNEEFIHRQNLSSYLRQISTTRDDAQRKQLIRLLAEERGKAKRNGWAPPIG